MATLRLTVGSVLLCLVACGSPHAMAIEIMCPLGSAQHPVVISGQAVDEGSVCSEAAFERFEYEDHEGHVLSPQEVTRLRKVQVESGQHMFGVIRDRFTCVDGTGSLVVVQTPLLDFDDLDFTGRNAVSSWSIEGGTGDLDGLSGDGLIYVDFPDQSVVFQGHVVDD